MTWPTRSAGRARVSPFQSAHQGRYRPRGGQAVAERLERAAAWIETILDPGGRE